MAELIKTKFAGIHYKEDAQTKVKTYIARINIRSLINTEQIVGYSIEVFLKTIFRHHFKQKN